MTNYNLIPFGVVVNGLALICWTCSTEYLNELSGEELNTTTFEWVSTTDYPDGYTCADCGDTYFPINNKENHQ